MSLQDVAAATKISVVALEALERHDYGRVPGGIFGRAFVRGYAGAVGLDPEAAVAEFLEERARREREAAKVVKRPEVTADDRLFLDRQQRAVRLLRSGLVVAAIVAVGVLAYELYIWWPRAPTPAVVTPPPEAPPPAPESTPPPAAPPTIAPPAGPPRVEPASESFVVEFTAKADCWLHLTADGEVVLDRQLMAGDRHTVKAGRELRIHAGNGGGLDWTINGQPARSLGNPGATARANLTRQNLKTFVR